MELQTNGMCRGCMSLEEDDLSDIFAQREIGDIFAQCTRLTIDSQDGLPHKICSKCLRQCLYWISFKRQCEDSEAELRKMIESKSVPPEPPESEQDDKDLPDVSFGQLKNELQEETTLVEIKRTVERPIPTNCVALKKSPRKRFICPLCGKICRDAERLEAHSRWHSGLKPEVCKICSKEFDNVRALRRHGVKHENNGKLHTCSDCGKTYKYRNSLRLHAKIHQSKPRYVCDFCGKSFFRAHGLQSHLLSHSTATPFPCDICSKQFKTKVMLRNHQIRHAGIKKFVCDECGKTFTTSAELTTHGRMHSGVKPFGCDICEKRYKTKSHLSVHMRSHTGSRPYACDFCPLKFAHNKVLKHHRLTHTGERPYTCTVCQKTFRQNSTMRVHMRVHSKAENRTISDKEFGMAMEIVEVTEEDVAEEMARGRIVLFDETAEDDCT